MSLYFIALIPEKELKERITALKKEIAERFNAKHALRLPAHITLYIPFNSDDENEPELTQALEAFAKQETPFRLELSGFGAFPPRVIYIDVTNPEPVQQLHERLKKLMINRFAAAPDEDRPGIHPHITIATRDLSKGKFRQAWPNFKDRPFRDEFIVNSLFLLKHSGKTWDIHSEFLME